MDDHTSKLPDNGIPEEVVPALRAEIAKVEPTRKRRLTEKFILAVLSSIPWVGGFISTAATYKTDEANIKENSLQNQWLEYHQTKLGDLQQTLGIVETRFESLGDEIDERVQSEEYLGLVKKAFRIWDEADTQEKRNFAANFITNAAGTRLCSDDVLRLFLDWLGIYNEIHLNVIRQIYKNPGYSRYEIWTSIYGDTLPREDSAEADLFRLLIRDLSTGGVLRQERDTNQLGQFVRKTPRRTRPGFAPKTLESSFEDQKPYALTELGKQFVHYVMTDAVTRLTAEAEPNS